MLASERFEKIVEIVNQKGFISTKELSVTMQVTETTIRRDCEELEKQGLLLRVHGGAKSVHPKVILSTKDEKTMEERKEFFYEKDIVCKKAASFVKDGDCIFLDGGTSIVPILPYIQEKKIKIVTHSHLIVDAFSGTESELFVIGGRYIPEYAMSVGPITISELDRFNFDLAFLSCAGIDLDRKLVYTAEMDTMAVKQKAMSLSAQKYLLIDRSKIAIKGFCSFIDSDDYFRRRKSVADENGVEYEDNDERCVFFARGVLETVKKLRWTPDIIHCQGWMASLAPLFVKKGYHDDPFFHDSKVVLSLLDKEYATPFRADFAEKVRMEEMHDSDLQTIMNKPVDYETLMKLAIDYSDGVVQATPSVNESLVAYAKEKGVNFMDYAGMDNYQAYIDFYNSLL